MKAGKCSSSVQDNHPACGAGLPPNRGGGRGGRARLPPNRCGCHGRAARATAPALPGCLPLCILGAVVLVSGEAGGVLTSIAHAHKLLRAAGESAAIQRPES